jgi:hypothetical protein
MEGITSVSVYNFDAGGAEVSLLLGGEFLGLCVQGKGTGISGFVWISGKAPVVLHDLVTHICIADRRSIIEMKEIIQISDFHLIG